MNADNQINQINRNNQINEGKRTMNTTLATQQSPGHGSAVVTLPSDTEIVITRCFRAPAALIFRAWTTPELVRQWWGSPEAPLVVCEIDLTVGGRWRYVSAKPGVGELGWHGTYRAIEPGRSLVSTEVFEGAPDAEAVDELTLTEQDGVTTLRVVVTHATKTGRDAHIASGMEAGMQLTLDRLEDLVVDQASIPPMQMKLELIPLPVADIDRAKAFYVDRVGFHLDVDVTPTEGMRIVQLTPPGSACSIVLSVGLPALDQMEPGTIKGVHLVVRDIDAARAELIGRGVEVSDVDSSAGSVKYAWFDDPDGNTLTLQEMAWRTGDAY